MSWLPSLDRKSANIEENLDIGDLDLAEVVLKYRTAESEARKSRLRRRQEVDSLKHMSAGTRKKGGKKLSILRTELQPADGTVINGIPVGVAARDYIKYRKCLFMDTIGEWRDQLSSALSPPVLDELQQLLTRLFRWEYQIFKGQWHEQCCKAGLF